MHNEDVNEIARTFYDLRDLFLPVTCACCGAYGQRMCGRSALCPQCDFLLRHSLLNIHRVALRSAQPVCYTSGIYEHELATAVLAYKNGGRTDLLPYLATGVSRAVKQLTELYATETFDRGSLLIIPVPSQSASARRRGFVPAELLAQATVRHIKTSLDSWKEKPSFRVVSALKARSRWGSTVLSNSGQKTLGAEARYQRMKDALMIGHPPAGFLGFEYDLAGCLCILIDDVVTTGASLNAAYQVLHQHGAQVLGAVTVASVPKRQYIPQEIL